MVLIILYFISLFICLLQAKASYKKANSYSSREDAQILSFFAFFPFINTVIAGSILIYLFVCAVNRFVTGGK